MRGIPFRVPNTASLIYDPGPQPFDPGQSVKQVATPFTLKPWPIGVPTLRTLLSYPGTPRARAPVAVNNQYSPDPSNYLFIAGFIGKSKG